MAKNKFSLNFDGFLDYAKRVDELGEGKLKEAVDNALTKSKDYANQQVMEAIEMSPYNFDGTGRSTGRTKETSEEVEKMPVEWNGTVAKAFSGVSWYDAPEAIILAYGTPHIKGDARLLNAIKCKGPIAKEVAKIQQEEFSKVIQEGMQS